MKRKFSLWLNIVTICLCICAVAVGVYAATNASLTVGGKVGFTAHGCDVDITAYMYGHSDDDTADGYPVAEADPTYLYQTASPLEIRSNTKTLDIGSRYFTDMASDTNQPDDIVVVITVTNVSAFKITATFDTTNITKPDNVTVTSDVETADIETDATATFKITLHLNANSDGSYTNITMPEESATNNLSMSFAFEKWSQFKVDSTTKMLTTTMGHGTDADYTYENEKYEYDIEWIAFAVKGENLGNSYSITDETTGDTWYSLNGVDMTDVDYSGKTFWFIQKYVVAGGYYGDHEDSDNESWITGQQFNASTSAGNDYDSSDIYTYLTSTYLTSTEISSADLYNSITTRSVSETYTVSSTSQTCAFDSKLWLISQAELGLLNGSAVSVGETYTYTLARAYGIGNTAGNAYGYGADWCLRSPYSGSSKCALIVDSYGNFDYYNVSGNDGYSYGVRAAFQITIA